MLIKRYIKSDNQFEIKRFNWKDIQKHLDDIVEMQLNNTFMFHYPDKTPNREIIKTAYYKLKNI